MNDIQIYKLDTNLARLDSQSNGWLLKWDILEDNHYVWIKSPGLIINWGGESYAEILAYTVAKDLKILNILKYEPCIIDLGKIKLLGCKSKEFYNRKYEMDYSFYKLMSQGVLDIEYSYKNIHGYSKLIKDCNHRLNLDIRKHLDNMIILDSIILNRDRTFRNFGVIANSYGGPLRLAPIYDSGSSFGLDIYFMTGEFDDELKYSNGFKAEPFDMEYEKQSGLVGCISNFKGYTINSMYNTLKMLEYFYYNFSDKHNKYNIANPIPIETIEFIRSVIIAGLNRIDRLVKNLSLKSEH